MFPLFFFIRETWVIIFFKSWHALCGVRGLWPTTLTPTHPKALLGNHPDYPREPLSVNMQTFQFLWSATLGKYLIIHIIQIQMDKMYFN
jgi:hypothetical protein